jgi:crotonobetainyl-CoA:carnitine CoA-transferase CaiB-like acyl-CoA transferase
MIIVAVANPGLWGRFCEAIERPELRDDPRFTTNTLRASRTASR